ncbi:MAG: Spy/CpxP family protein refolding chaperone [Candidatus Thiodiazotropha taylori]|nr:Spy/CpxP family protein refolding chaperone [Candidatus Thiodiazotropha taylori]
MSKTVIIIVSLLVLLLISGVAIARYKGLCGNSEARIGWMAERLDKHLDLTDNQRVHLDKFRSEIISMAETLRSDREIYANEAADLLNQSSLDRERAHTLLMQKQAQLASISSDFIDAFADFSDNLDQHQRNKLQTMILHHKAHRHCAADCNTSAKPDQE